MDKSSSPAPAAANENHRLPGGPVPEASATPEQIQLTLAERTGLALLLCGASFAEAEASTGVRAERLLDLWLARSD
jgi:hypothetical protein